uniref:Protein kinase domain-containing protein n=1 Tax=Mola mola TaxID=94237 RepID=A0A3Q3X1W5_MOLML
RNRDNTRRQMSSCPLRNFKKDDFEADWTKVAECRFGQTYQVKLKVWRVKCALKSFHTNLCPNNFYSTSDFLKLLITDEVSNMAKIKFQYIVSIYGMCDEATALVMEYMSKGSLNNLLASHTLMWPKKFQMIYEASMGMNFLHSMKPPLLHLNLKTPNILLDDHLHVKISDFGLIHWEEGMSKKLFMENLIARGNINYIPPETFTQSSDPPGTAYDVYSFAIVMWEILTQQKPYTGRMLLQVSHGKRPCLEILPEQRPQECKQIISIMRQCWDQDHRKRPQFSGKFSVFELSPNCISTFCLIFSLNFSTFYLDFGSFRQSVRREHVYMRFSDENSLLHYTVASRDAASVEHVLSLGADVNCTTAGGYTPLILAVLYRLQDIISLLLEYGAAASQGDEDQWTALHFAAQNGDDRSARLLLDKGAVGDAQERAGWTPLHLACQNGHEAVVRLLLSRLSREAVGEREAQERTPLHLASAYGHCDIAKLLLAQGADPNATDCNLSTALHLSAEEGHNRLVRQLLKSGVTPDSADSGGYTPLHLAALKGHSGICRQLLSNSASPDSRTIQGWTPMHLASLKGNEATVVELEKHGGSVNARGENGWTPLHLACNQSEPKLVERLLATGAEPNVSEDGKGWTPLHMACASLSFPSVLHLISNHADVNAVNSGKATPLHVAAQHGCVPIVKALLLNGADKTLLDSSGSTALDVANRCEKQEIVCYSWDLLEPLSQLGGYSPEFSYHHWYH